MPLVFSPFTGNLDFTGSGGGGGGSGSWRAPVANFAALPPSGNAVGDMITTLDTLVIWAWDGAAWISETGGAGAGVSSLNALSGALNIVAGSGIGVSASGSSVTISTTANLDGGSPSDVYTTDQLVDGGGP